MKNIADEIRHCLEVTGATQRALSLASGVPASTICNLLQGKRRNLFGDNQDKLRAAMSRMIQACQAESLSPSEVSHDADTR